MWMFSKVFNTNNKDLLIETNARKIVFQRSIHIMIKLVIDSPDQKMSLFAE